jgi:hypothetical protein
MGIASNIAAYLRRELPDVPLIERQEGSGHADGINVYPFTRRDLPSTAFPYRGTAVHIMYTPEGAGDWEAWVEAAREKLMTRYGHRWRPMPTAGKGWFLIEAPNTAYARSRQAEYEKRASLGFPPLHAMSK